MRTCTCMAGIGVVAFLAGCTAPSHTLGKAPDNSRNSAVATTHHEGDRITLQGKMIEKCPVAACWFRLKDKTGVVKVDVKGAYFTVSDVPLDSTVTVTGTWQQQDGTPVLLASGLSY